MFFSCFNLYLLHVWTEKLKHVLRFSGVLALRMIGFGHPQISMPKIGIPMSKMVCINSCQISLFRFHPDLVECEYWSFLYYYKVMFLGILISMEGWGGQTKMAGFCVQMYFPFFDFECPNTLQYWVDVQQGQSHLMGRRCIFSLGLSPF